MTWFQIQMQRMRRKIILNIGELQHQSEEVHGRLASYTEEIALGCWRRRPCITHTDTLYLCVAAAAALLSQLNISNLANAKEAKRCNRNESDGKKNTEWRTNNNLFAVHVECELVRFFEIIPLDGEYTIWYSVPRGRRKFWPIRKSTHSADIDSNVKY